jgi:uncharacterized membrane protein
MPRKKNLSPEQRRQIVRLLREVKDDLREVREILEAHQARAREQTA